MSAFSQTKNLAIVVGAAVSGPFTTEEFQRGSFICTAVVTNTINFDVSEDGTNWDTLSNADAAFTSLAAPAANLPRCAAGGPLQVPLRQVPHWSESDDGRCGDYRPSCWPTET
jgi:hypothetical protein